MHDRWANLLANAGTGLAIPPAFPDILRQLEPIEAQLLDDIVPVNERGLLQRTRLPRHLPDQFPGLRFRHLDNLERLHLIEYVCDAVTPWGPDDAAHDVRFGTAGIARSLVVACQPPKQEPVRAVRF
jgi:hypothetical protein